MTSLVDRYLPPRTGFGLLIVLTALPLVMTTLLGLLGLMIAWGFGLV